jgi:hypothetical protein
VTADSGNRDGHFEVFRISLELLSKKIEFEMDYGPAEFVNSQCEQRRLLQVPIAAQPGFYRVFMHKLTRGDKHYYNCRECHVLKK